MALPCFLPLWYSWTLLLAMSLLIGVGKKLSVLLLNKEWFYTVLSMCVLRVSQKRWIKVKYIFPALTAKCIIVSIRQNNFSRINKKNSTYVFYPWLRKILKTTFTNKWWNTLMCPFHLMLPVDVSVVVVQKSRTTVIKVYLLWQ